MLDAAYAGLTLADLAHGPRGLSVVLVAFGVVSIVVAGVAELRRPGTVRWRRRPVGVSGWIIMLLVLVAFLWQIVAWLT